MHLKCKMCWSFAGCWNANKKKKKTKRLSQFKCENGNISSDHYVWIIDILGCRFGYRFTASGPPCPLPPPSNSWYCNLGKRAMRQIYKSTLCQFNNSPHQIHRMFECTQVSHMVAGCLAHATHTHRIHIHAKAITKCTGNAVHRMRRNTRANNTTTTTITTDCSLVALYIYFCQTGNV